MAPGVGPAEHRELSLAGASRRTWLCVGAPLVAGLVHVALVAPWYFVGSFDDDAGYVLGARALAAGHGLTAHLANGTVLAGSTPPGYSALLTPLVVAFGNGFTPLRLLSVLSFAACFPLLWVWTGQRRVAEPVRVGALALLALDPVAATFASMVMPEMPTVAVLLVLLCALERWDGGARAAAVVVACAVALVWLKEAAVAIDAGLVLWLWWRRRWGKGALVAAAVAASLVPVVAARLVAGVPIAGSRYSEELGAYYSGGLGGRVLHVLPAALHQLLSVALPASVVPRGAPLWYTGFGGEVLRVVSWQVSILTVAGFAVWVRRRRDVTVALVPLYLLESLLWPYVNERRVILVLPVVLVWYATGVAALGAAVLRWWSGGRPAYLALVGLVVGAPLLAQAPRDYLYNLGQTSSRPQGSRYMALMARAPAAADVVETDYLSTTALFAGHRSAESAFIANDPLAADLRCVPDVTDLADLRADRAGWVLAGDLNKPSGTDNPCMLAALTTRPWAVRLLRTARDDASVFELIGPGTVHPRLADVTATAQVSGSGGLSTWALAAQDPSDTPGGAPETRAAGGTATITWDWGRQVAVHQVSVGGARSLDGATSAVGLQLLEAGRWVTVASAGSGVGDGTAVPYLLTSVPVGTEAVAARVVFAATGTVAAVDFHVLGEG